jgi:hypothetical protein
MPSRPDRFLGLPTLLSSGIKWPGREADHLPPSGAEIKNAWSYTSTPQYVFMALCLVQHMDSFTLPYLLPLLYWHGCHYY